MSASQVSSLDIENPAADLSIHHDKHNFINTTTTTTQNIWGEAKSTPAAKRFERHLPASLQKGLRSFGEISNTLDRGYDGGCSGDTYKKILTHHHHQQHQQHHQQHHQQQHQPPICSSVSEEPEFIPTIRRKKDYSDLLPPSLCLSHDQMTDFTHIWKHCQKPDLLVTGAPPPSSSPPLRDLTFLHLIQDEPKIRLEPIPDDLFDLPSPWE